MRGVKPVASRRLSANASEEIEVAGIAEPEVRMGVDVCNREGRLQRADFNCFSPPIEQLGVILDHEARKLRFKATLLLQKPARVLQRPRREFGSVEPLVAGRPPVGGAFDEEVEVDIENPHSLHVLGQASRSSRLILAL
jgi:hypothetical protein